MKWVQLEDRLFDARRAVVIVDRSVWYVTDWLAKAGIGDPELLRPCFVELLQKHRPELANAFIAGIEFDISAVAWRFTICHESLEECPMGTRPKAYRMRDWIEAAAELEGVPNAE